MHAICVLHNKGRLVEGALKNDAEKNIKNQDEAEGGWRKLNKAELYDSRFLHALGHLGVERRPTSK